MVKITKLKENEKAKQKAQELTQQKKELKEKVKEKAKGMQGSLTPFLQQKVAEKQEEETSFVTVRPTVQELRALVNKALADMKDAKFDDAVAPLQIVARFVPKNVAVWYYLAQAYYHLNTTEKAYKCCRRVLRLNPDHVNTYELIARMLLKAKNWDKASPTLKLVIQLDPSRGSAYYNLGQAYKVKGNEALSVRYLKLAEEKGFRR